MIGKADFVCFPARWLNSSARCKRLVNNGVFIFFLLHFAGPPTLTHTHKLVVVHSWLVRVNGNLRGVARKKTTNYLFVPQWIIPKWCYDCRSLFLFSTMDDAEYSLSLYRVGVCMCVLIIIRLNDFIRAHQVHTVCRSVSVCFCCCQLTD